MCRPEHVQRIETALASSNPERELHQLAVALRDEGVSQIDLYLLFERFCRPDKAAHPKPDAILDTLDLIYGGRFAKGKALYPQELDEKAINDFRRTI